MNSNAALLKIAFVIFFNLDNDVKILIPKTMLVYPNNNIFEKISKMKNIKIYDCSFKDNLIKIESKGKCFDIEARLSEGDFISRLCEIEKEMKK